MRRAALLLMPLALVAACKTNIGAGNPSGDAPVAHTLESAVYKADDRKPAPSLSGTTLDGQQLDTSAMRGKVVVVNFWASWCGPCRAEARNLNSVYAATKDSGVEFVGVDIRDVKVSGQSFQRSKGVVYPSLFDSDGTLLLKFRGQAPQNPPTTLIFDRQGRVAARFVTAVTESQLLIPVQTIAKEPA